MNYEQLANELTRIRKELEDIKVSVNVDDVTLNIVDLYLRQAHNSLLSAVNFIKYRQEMIKREETI